MLSRLVIHDVVLIEKLSLPLEKGLNVFTGETGAGKSIVLDALGLALGGRGDAALVRAGAAQASVAAEFHLEDNHKAFVLAEEQGLDAENPVILRRVIGKDGKSRAFFNDQPIGVGLLRKFGESLLEVHGQFDTHGLFNTSLHRELLDAFARLESLHSKTATACREWKEAVEKAREAEAARDRAKNEEDYLRAAVLELQDLAPEPGEADSLADKRTELQHREKILEALAVATQLMDGERGAVSSLSQAGRAVARVSDKSPGIPEILSAIDRALNEASEASLQLSRFSASLDSRADGLQAIEERLFALRAAARKHNVQIDQLPEVLGNLSARLALLTNEGEQVGKRAEDAARARHAYIKLAEDLSAKRKAAAVKLEREVNRELPPLKLERAAFFIDIANLSEEQWTEDGMDRITFLASTNAGSPPGPLHKIASGGELSRFMLALKTALAAADPVPVLVFDEVDTGIGGAIASAVGERLGRLAEEVQILVVTHSPQVAARGSHHLRVVKRAKAGKTITEVEVLDAAARREEIARMLAGTIVTEAARKAADSLLLDLPGSSAKQNKRKACL
ncbi:MAG: DNA repair protein RecN [Alphaproteobacteria bacterium]|nr:DNA repair protein RecN [Alphaproteobacteria bacterium]